MTRELISKAFSVSMTLDGTRVVYFTSNMYNLLICIKFDSVIVEEENAIPNELLNATSKERSPQMGVLWAFLLNELVDSILNFRFYDPKIVENHFTPNDISHFKYLRVFQIKIKIFSFEAI